MLNRAVKVLPVLLKEDKEYVAVMRLHGDVSEEELRRVVEDRWLGLLEELERWLWSED